MKKLARLWAIFAIALLALTTSCEEPTPAPLYAAPEVLTFATRCSLEMPTPLSIEKISLPT